VSSTWSALEHARAFSPTFVDVPSLNARVSDTILASVEDIRSQSRAVASSLLVLGPAGAGKTHLFERMRRKSGLGATFVHVKPEIGIETTMATVLQRVFDALKYPVADQEYTQLDLVVGAALAHLDGESPQLPNAYLDKARAMPEEAREERIGRLLDILEKQERRLDEGWLELLVRRPFMANAARRAALSWLSGREPSEVELARLGYATMLPAARITPALRALATLAAQAVPLVIVFDQLENLVEMNGSADYIHAYARVFAELFDEVSRVVLVQMSLNGEWDKAIKPHLAPSELSRIETTKLHLALPNAQERDELLQRWLEQLPAAERPGSFPAPFTAESWQQWRKQPGVTPRMLLVAARRALEGEPPVVDTTTDTVDTIMTEHWERAQRKASKELDDAFAEKRGVDEDRLTAATRVLLQSVPDTQVLMQPKRSGRETLRFIREGRDTSVFATQSTNGTSVAATLGHASKLAETKPVFVVREQALPLRPSWKAANARMQELKQSKFAQVIEVARTEIVRALAVHDLYAAARSQDLMAADGRPLAETEVREWIDRELKPYDFLLSLSDTTKPPDLPPPPPPPPPPPHDFTNLVLRELRLASVERVIAEVRNKRPDATRDSTLAALRDNPAVKWFGRSIVHLPSETP